jgi:hypothetical protein
VPLDDDDGFEIQEDMGVLDRMISVTSGIDYVDVLYQSNKYEVQAAIRRAAKERGVKL